MNRIFTIVATLSLFATLGATSLHAGAWNASRSIQLEIPVDFQISGEAFSAGQYTLGPVSDAAPNLLVIRSADGRQSAFTFARLASDHERPNVVFSYNGESYDLVSYSRGIYL